MPLVRKQPYGASNEPFDIRMTVIDTKLNEHRTTKGPGMVSGRLTQYVAFKHLEHDFRSNFSHRRVFTQLSHVPCLWIGVAEWKASTSLLVFIECRGKRRKGDRGCSLRYDLI